MAATLSASDSAFLPQEILVEILSKLPAKSVVRFKCVSKFFCSLVVDHPFADLHRNWSLTLPSRMSILISLPRIGFINFNGYYTINYCEENQGKLRANPLQYIDRNYFFVSSSVNGLICFCGYSGRDDIAIHNLSTRQHISLPSTCPRRINRFEGLYAFGALGFDSVSRRYKVLKSVFFTNHYNKHVSVKHWVFTLGVDKSWREIHSSPSSGRINMLFNSRISVHIDGVIYLIHSFNGPDIVAFDVRAENFQAIPPPRPAAKLAWGLVEVEGRLAIVRLIRDRDNIMSYSMAIWILEESMVWNKILIPIPFPLKEVNRRDLFFATNHIGEITMLVKPERSVYILFYNFRRQSWRKFDLLGPVPTAIYFILDNVNLLH